MTAVYTDAEPEHDVVGSCLLSPAAVDAVIHQLAPGDFGSVHAAAAFAAVCSLHKVGAGIDASTVADELRRQGAAWDGHGADLLSWATDVPNPSNVAAYATIVRRFAARRSVHAIGTELVDAAGDAAADPADAAEAARARLATLDSVGVASPGDVEVDSFIVDPEDVSPPVVPGLLAEDDRVVIVAPEGVGKSELTRQLVVAAAYGIHPFRWDAMPAVPTLLVDLENGRALVRRRLRYLASVAERHRTGERATATLWHRPGGIDLRRRTDRGAFEDVLRRRRPKLVVLAPVYKSYVRTGRETDEQVAAEVQAILDDLRTRYRFALVLEHHAPQANGGSRELRPFGSSLWLRWPEYGLKLTPSRDRSGGLVVGRWRGDRSEADWPDELHRGQLWPWEPRWNVSNPRRTVA